MEGKRSTDEYVRRVLLMYDKGYSPLRELIVDRLMGLEGSR